MSKIEQIKIPYAFDRRNAVIDFSRDELMQIAAPIIDKALRPIDAALEKADLEKDDIDLIIMAGGSSQLPGVAEKLYHKMGKKPKIIPRNLMLAVSYGATLRQREIASYPLAKPPKHRLGTSLGIMVSDNGRSIPKLLLDHKEELPASEFYHLPIDEGQREVSLHLVTLKGNRDVVEKTLNTRTLKLERDASEIVVQITVTKDRLIELKAWDPKHEEQKAIIQTDQYALTEREINKKRKTLGIGLTSFQSGTGRQPCIGIDLGTTTTELTYSERNLSSELHYLENPDSPTEYSKYSFPSIVYYKEGQDTPEVSNQSAVNALNDVDLANRVFSNFKTENRREFLREVDGKQITVMDLSAVVLSKVWETAQNYFSGLKLEKAFVTVPAKFDFDQCRETVDAAHIAGIKDVTLIDEPTAAFEYYKSQNDIDISKIRYVLVFDFGGGTTDVAILDLQDNSDAENNEFKECLYNVIGIDGDPDCGGKEVDKKILDYLKEKIERKYSEKLKNVPLMKLRNKIEEVKVKLSEDDEDDL